jgi:hypothetical protein
MISCIINIVLYTSIICIILLHDTTHYAQPYLGPYKAPDYKMEHLQHIRIPAIKMSFLLSQYGYP